MAKIVQRPLGNCVECGQVVVVPHGETCFCGEAFHYKCKDVYPSDSAALVCGRKCKDELHSFLFLKKKMSLLQDENLALKLQLYENHKINLGIENKTKTYASVVSNRVQQDIQMSREVPKEMAHFNPYTNTTRIYRSVPKHQVNQSKTTQYTQKKPKPPTQIKHVDSNSTKIYNQRMQRYVSHASSTSARTTANMHDKPPLSKEQIAYRQHQYTMAKKFNIKWEDELKQRKEKQFNVVIMGVPDKFPEVTLEKEDRSNVDKNADLKILREFIEQFGIDTKDVSECFRMGATGPHRRNPRPMKVKCTDNGDMKQFFLDNDVCSKLQIFFGSDTIKIRRDKTLIERIAAKYVYNRFFKKYPNPEEGTHPFSKKN